MIESSWYDRYRIALKERLSVKEIMQLCGVGQPTALQLRREAVEYCIKNDIPMVSNKPPTHVILSLIDKSVDYYHTKMVMELEAIERYKKVYG